MTLMETRNRILIVEDDPEIIRAEEKLFREAGLEVFLAQSGQEGLDEARRIKPDLILLDVLLPDTNGYLVCEAVKTDPDLQDIFILLISGKKVDSQSQAKGLELGADGYLVRPITNRELVARVMSLLRIKNTEMELRQTKEALQGAHQDLQQFAYAISHDLQEPLRMITSFLNLLEKRSRDKLDESEREYIAFAVDGAERMRDMINGVLRFSRVNTRGDDFSYFSSRLACDNALENLRVLINETGAEVQVWDLPEIWGDELQITQVFQNLISNGIKFNQRNPPQVVVEAKPEEDAWVFSVEDNGIGIAINAQERIFNIFQRLHTQEDYQGSGVGLTICKRIVQRHQGSIWVESKPGEGSTFYFRIPKH